MRRGCTGGRPGQALMVARCTDFPVFFFFLLCSQHYSRAHHRQDPSWPTQCRLIDFSRWRGREFLSHSLSFEHGGDSHRRWHSAADAGRLRYDALVEPLCRHCVRRPPPLVAALFFLWLAAAVGCTVLAMVGWLVERVCECVCMVFFIYIFFLMLGAPSCAGSRAPFGLCSTSSLTWFRGPCRKPTERSRQRIRFFFFFFFFFLSPAAPFSLVKFLVLISPVRDHLRFACPYL